MSFQTTRGIIFQQVRYSETSLIVKAYTEDFGLSSFMLKGVRKPRSPVSPALLQHLSVVEIVVNLKPGKGLHHVKEIRNFFPFHHIPFDIRKSSILLFINELLNKAVREEEPNRDLYDFLLTSLQILDLTKENVNNFHVWFCLQLTRFLGFLPAAPLSRSHMIFDLKEGLFLLHPPDHQYYAAQPTGRFFETFSRPGFRDFHLIAMNNEERRILINAILDYYQLHLPGFGRLKSHLVLETVFGE